MRVPLLFALLLFQTTPPAPVPASNVSVALPRQYRNVPLIRQTNGTYIIHSTMKAVKGLAIYRNGLRQSPAVDFDYVSSTGVITPKPAAPWEASDIVLADFEI